VGAVVLVLADGFAADVEAVVEAGAGPRRGASSQAQTSNSAQKHSDGRTAAVVCCQLDSSMPYDTARIAAERGEMFESRWLLALGAGLVLVLVSIAMIAGFQDDPPRRSERPPQRLAPPQYDDEEQEAESTEAAESEETWADDEPEEPADGLRELSGTVTNASRAALEGVEVEVENFGRLRTVSDEDGHFVLHSVPTQALTLIARATGFGDTRVDVKRGEPDAEQTVNVALEDGDGVAGSVVNPEGASVEGAQVACIDDAKQQRGVSTDRYGRFELPETSVGCEGAASYQGFDDSAPAILELGSANLLVLARPASIAGVVLDAEGRPPRSFVISIESFRPAAGGEAERRYRQTFSNPRGSFTVRGLKAGSYVFSVGLPGGKQFRTQPIAVKRGQALTGVRIAAQ
jgi:hypothetical protein